VNVGTAGAESSVEAMMRTDEQYWSAVRELRLGVADLLESLDPAEWEAGSLCEQWRVRDVAGHLSIVPTITSVELISALPRARFDLNRVNTSVARRYGASPTDEIVGRIRRHAGDRCTARLLDTRDALFDVIVHSQDIALPLERTFPVPADLSRQGLERVWGMGWPFRARRRLAGYRLRATDTGWAVGEGPEVAGPSLALLLLLTGRSDAAMGSLEGAGVGRLAA
jgi:uncharacterized protein (TIGR03083 family)